MGFLRVFLKDLWDSLGFSFLGFYVIYLDFLRDLWDETNMFSEKLMVGFPFKWSISGDFR